MKSREVLKGHDFSRATNKRNRPQRGFRLRCFLDGEFASVLRSEFLKGPDFR